MPPRFQDVSIRIALLSFVQEVSLRNDADDLPSAIDNRQPAHPIALEKSNGFLESRLRRCGHDPPRHYLVDCDHAPIVARATPAGLGRNAPVGWDHRPSPLPAAAIDAGIHPSKEAN